MKLHPSLRLCACAVILALSPMTVYAGDHSVMHCFAWTPVQQATPADWQAFYQASDALPKKIKGIVRVWYGKLLSPLGQTQLQGVDDAAFQKFTKGELVTVPVHRVTREYGMCMEMKNEDVLNAYDADPYHKIWTAAYAKIRVEGTTTFNILGQ